MTACYPGKCFCGAVEIEASGQPAEMGYGHCESCRTYSGAPVSAFTLWTSAQVKVIKGEDLLGGFNKMGFSDRRYCTKCGGHVMVYHPSIGLTDVHASTIPGLPFEAKVHLNYAETVLPMKDGLPKLRDLPAEVGGTGETMAE